MNRSRKRWDVLLDKLAKKWSAKTSSDRKCSTFKLLAGAALDNLKGKVEGLPLFRAIPLWLPPDASPVQQQYHVILASYEKELNLHWSPNTARCFTSLTMYLRDFQDFQQVFTNVATTPVTHEKKVRTKKEQNPQYGASFLSTVAPERRLQSAGFGTCNDFCYNGLCGASCDDGCTGSCDGCETWALTESCDSSCTSSCDGCESWALTESCDSGCTYNCDDCEWWAKTRSCDSGWPVKVSSCDACNGAKTLSCDGCTSSCDECNGAKTTSCDGSCTGSCDECNGVNTKDCDENCVSSCDQDVCAIVGGAIVHIAKEAVEKAGEMIESFAECMEDEIEDGLFAEAAETARCVSIVVQQATTPGCLDGTDCVIVIDCIPAPGIEFEFEKSVSFDKTSGSANAQGSVTFNAGAALSIGPKLTLDIAHHIYTIALVASLSLDASIHLEASASMSGDFEKNFELPTRTLIPTKVIMLGYLPFMFGLTVQPKLDFTGSYELSGSIDYLIEMVQKVFTLEASVTLRLSEGEFALTPVVARAERGGFLIKTGDIEIMFSCEGCDQSFTDTLNAQANAEMHLNANPYLEVGGGCGCAHHAHISNPSSCWILLPRKC
jgi:hypothetical protein